MRPITPVIVGLATFAAAALAQSGTAPIESKTSANAQSADQVAPSNTTANTVTPRDTAPATPDNSTAPDEPKL